MVCASDRTQDIHSGVTGVGPLSDQVADQNERLSPACVREALAGKGSRVMDM